MILMIHAYINGIGPCSANKRVLCTVLVSVILFFFIVVLLQRLHPLNVIVHTELKKLFFRTLKSDDYIRFHWLYK